MWFHLRIFGYKNRKRCGIIARDEIKYKTERQDNGPSFDISLLIMPFQIPHSTQLWIWFAIEAASYSPLYHLLFASCVCVRSAYNISIRSNPVEIYFKDLDCVTMGTKKGRFLRSDWSIFQILFSFSILWLRIGACCRMTLRANRKSADEAGSATLLLFDWKKKE